MNDKNRWARFTLTITAALVLTLIIIFVPVTAGTAIQVNVPISPHGTAIDVVLPFGTTSVYATGGLTITKAVNPSPVNQGELLTYTLVVSNETGLNLTDFTVTDTVPANTTCVESP